MKDPYKDISVPKCPTCHELLKPMRCKCIGGKKEASNSGSSYAAPQAKKSVDAGKAGQRYHAPKPTPDAQRKQIPHTVKTKEQHLEELALSNREFNRDVISELLAKGLLTIENLVDDMGMDLGMLLIKLPFGLRPLTPHERKEFKNYLNAIFSELEEFKDTNKLKSKCFALGHDTHGNIIEMRVTIGQDKLYKAFIQQLAEKQMLPLQIINQQNKLHDKPNDKSKYEHGMNHFTHTPFSTKPPSPFDKRPKQLRPKYPTDTTR